MKQFKRMLAMLLTLATVMAYAVTPALADEGSTRTLTLSDTTKTLAIGESFTLTAATTPADLYVDYSTSDANVATVDAASGEVKAVAAGTATITAALEVDSNVTATCEVTVSGAAKISCGTDIYYSIDDAGVLTISGTGTMTDWVNDFSAADAGWVSSRNSITKIVVEEGVTNIGGGAFGFMYTYPNVKEIELPFTLKSLGAYAFKGCTGLEKVTTAGTASPSVKSNSFPANTTINIPYKATGYDADPWTSWTIVRAENPNKAALSEMNVDVTVSTQAEGAYVKAPETLTVNGYEAESFGYEDALTDQVSVLDAAVAEAEAILGEDFNEETKDTYLVIKNGYISTLFGVETMAVGFTVNGKCPTDGTVCAWGGYNGLMINLAPIVDGDVVEFIFYQDTTNYLDNYASFTEDTPDTALTGEAVKVGVQGYSLCYYGCWEEQIKDHIAAIAGASIGLMNTESGEITALDPEVVTDEDGYAAITFDQAGTYTIAAYGTDDNDIPLTIATKTIKVEMNPASTIDGIAAIPAELTLADKAAVEAARAAYDALDETAKANVTNYQTLQIAEKTIEILQAKQDYATLQQENEANKTELAAAKKELAAAKLALAKTKAKYATVSGLKVTSKSKKLTVTWKKNSAVTGYQVSYKLKTAKSYSTLKTTTTLKAVSKALKKGKVYQVKVRPYTKINGTKVYGQYTSVKTVTCK